MDRRHRTVTDLPEGLEERGTADSFGWGQQSLRGADDGASIASALSHLQLKRKGKYQNQRIDSKNSAT